MMTGKMTENERLEATQEEVDEIKRWLKIQPHLPDKMNEVLIRRFLHSCKYDMAVTKKTMDLYFTLRNQAPEIFADRDPKNSEIMSVFDTAYMCPLPKLTPEKYKLFLYKFKDPNPDLYVFNMAVKGFLMLADARMITETELSAGEVPIFDMTGVTFRFVTKIVYSTLKKYMRYTQEAHPVRLKQIHVINAPSYVDKLFSIVKPMLNSDVIKMIHFHTVNSESLYKYVPKELLPDEFGGEAGKIEDIRLYWKNQVITHRDYYLDENWWKVDETKRSLKIDDCADAFDTLAID